jgi:hypothetical protein
MSYHDEFNELEKRLRQSKPQTESLPPALKRQMRQELMEQMTMNESRFSFRKLSMALGGLILLIGIPVFFWLAQMSIGTGEVPGAAPDTTPIETTRPSPTRVRNVAVAQGMDRVWLMSTDIPQGETIGRHDTIFVTVGYEMVREQDAALIIKFVEGPQVLLAVTKTVSSTLGIATIPIPLAELEAPEGDLVTLELNLIIGNLDQSGQKIVYQDLGLGWTVDLTAEPPVTTAEIVHISKPSIVETDGVDNESVYEVEMTVAYSLSGIDSAVLVVGYEFVDPNGGGGGYEVHAVSAGSGEIEITLWITREFFNARGELIDGVNFFARINRYDESSAEWVNVYPGNTTLMDAERNLPYPYYQDTIFIQSTVWDQDETGQAFLNVSLGYNLESQESAEATITIIGENNIALASETVVIEKGDRSITVPIAFAPSDLGNDAQSWISAELATEAGILADEQLWWVTADLADGEADADNAANEPVGQSDGGVWIIATNVVTQTTENGVKVDITLVVGYDLSGDYSGGRIDFSNQFQSADGNGGGGGGSSNPVEAGNGTTEFVFGFETTSWEKASDWLNNMSNHLELYGHSPSGEILIGEIIKIGAD